MAFPMIYLHVGICMLVLPTAFAGLLGRDTNIDQNSLESETRLLSRLLKAERQKMVAPEAVETELLEDKETVEKIDADRTKIDVTAGNELVERHIRDCNKKYEIIMLKDDDKNKRPKACYLRNMDEALYASACLGKEEMLKQTFIVTEEVVNKEFLSQDGPDSVCRDIPMFNTMTTNDVDQGDTSLRRELNVSKKTTCRAPCSCRTSCGLQCKGWWNCPWVCTTKCS